MLSISNKPQLYLHTQYNRDIPWDTIDMDFMNLNQSDHGDREFGRVVCASLIDLGGRMRLIVNEVNGKEVQKDLPNLPVARVLWTPEPSLKLGAKAWILSGGGHHTSFSYKVDTEQLLDLANLYGIECIVIDKNTDINNLTKELRDNKIYWKVFN